MMHSQQKEIETIPEISKGIDMTRCSIFCVEAPYAL